jgi:hypothetical protein
MTSPLRRWLMLNLASQLRNGRWFIALIAFAVLFFAGVAWAETDKAMFGSAMFVSTIIGLNFGIAADRRSGFHLCTPNYSRPSTVLAAKTAVGLGLFCVFCLVAFSIAAITWQDVKLASWSVAHSMLILGLVVSLTFMLEVLTGFEMSAAIASVVVVLGGFKLLTLDIQHNTALLGLNVVTNSFASLHRLLVINLVWGAIFFGLGALIWQIQNRDYMN